MPDVSGREFELLKELFETKFSELKAGQEAIGGKIDAKPCDERGEEIAVLKQFHENHDRMAQGTRVTDGLTSPDNGAKWLIKNWRLVLLVLGAGVLGGGGGKLGEVIKELVSVLGK